MDIITVETRKFQKEVEENDFNFNWRKNTTFEYHTFDQTGMDCLTVK